jgi:hypothetical protein
VVKKVDSTIYKGILEPLIVEVVNEVSEKQGLDIKSTVVSDKGEEEEEEEEEEIPIIVLWITFCK